MNPEDPFLAAQSDVLTQLESTRPLLTSYLRIRRTAQSASSPELLDARRELQASLKDLSTDLQDLIDSVKAVEGDPYRYGLEINEVERRRKLVKDVGDEVEVMRREVEKTIEAGSGRGDSPDPRAFEDEEQGGGEDDYAQFERQRQEELLHEQDEQLDGVFKTVGNLRRQADDMGRELEEQGELLDSVDTITDRVGGKLQQGVKRIGWVIRNNEDRWSSCCIAVLIVVLIVLLILVLLI